jgi:hypothetical protein
MTDNFENLIPEHLKKMQAELSVARKRDAEIISRLLMLEERIARIGRNESSN